MHCCKRSLILFLFVFRASHDSASTTLKYKGIHFGALRSQRMAFGGQDGPGPGEYSPYKPKQQNDMVSVINPEGKVFESRLPRYRRLLFKQLKVALI